MKQPGDQLLYEAVKHETLDVYEQYPEVVSGRPRAPPYQLPQKGQNNEELASHFDVTQPYADGTV